jgi:hypothetical protein
MESNGVGMTCRIAATRPAATRARPVVARIATLAALAALIAVPLTVPHAARAGSRHHTPAHRASEAEAPRAAGTPLMAIVSLRDQQVTVYDADGWILRSPVSTGMKGRETPAGVFAVIQKERDHYSNL